MADKTANTQQNSDMLPALVEKIINSTGPSDVTTEHLWYAIRGALNPGLLISNIAEALRISATDTEAILKKNGFGDLVAQHQLAMEETSELSKEQKPYQILNTKQTIFNINDLFTVEFSPRLDHPVSLTSRQHNAVSLIKESIVNSAETDAFLSLYRKDVHKYHQKFIESDAGQIDTYISEHFKEYPKYLINSGIGANEQFNHFVAHLNNSNKNRKITWLIIDSPRHLQKLPKDANVSNTVFMEFSRSGKTEETLKIHEYTPRSAKRIVFANSGPLRDIGERDNNLLLSLPDQVSGRFGRNKTPILLAPMHAAKMDTNQFWLDIEKAIHQFNLSSDDNLPIQMAQFIYLYQKINKINHIYLGCNDNILENSADELIQFWNEGVNKDGNDISMSRYLGLLRDSHLNIEGLLANSKTKMGIFLFLDAMKPNRLPPMTSETIDPINKAHKGLTYGDEEKIMAEANYLRFSELMPAIKINVLGKLTLTHAAFLGQFWSDLTFCYSRMMNVDPGSNPEVKHVRDRSAKLLSDHS